MAPLFYWRFAQNKAIAWFWCRLRLWSALHSPTYAYGALQRRKYAYGAASKSSNSSKTRHFRRKSYFDDSNNCRITDSTNSTSRARQDPTVANGRKTSTIVKFGPGKGDKYFFKSLHFTCMPHPKQTRIDRFIDLTHSIFWKATYLKINHY